MGVNHLRKGASAAKGSVSVRGLSRPASNSGTTKVPRVGSVQAYSSRAVRTGNHPAQPPKGASNGGRAGAKSGRPNVGSKGPKAGPSGGRLG